MTFDATYIRDPEQFDLGKWCFAQDLRRFFPALESNHEICDELEKRKVIAPTTDERDSESACAWIYFKTEDDARAFLNRLNALPEIRDYISESPGTITMTKPEWDRLKAFLQKTLTLAQYRQLQKLKLQIDETVVE